MTQLIQAIPYLNLTTVQRDALTGVFVGYKIFNTDFSMIEEWNGTEWTSIEQIRWRDEYASGIWTPAAASAAPDIVGNTIAGVGVRKYTFDGVNTEERLSNHFEIPHDLPLNLINNGTLILEVHVHWQPSTNDAGNVEWFFDYAYMPLNAAPIVQNSLSCVCPVAINEQYFHKIAAFKDGTNTVRIPVPIGGFSIGDIIQFNLRRTPTGTNDTYAHDAILIKCAMHVCSNDRGSTNMYNN